MEQNLTSHLNKVFSVKAHARLHMGFFDLQGGPLCKFGSLGMTLNNPVTEIDASVAEKFAINRNIDAKSSENIAKITQRLQKKLNLQGSLNLHVNSLIPQHIGLGSGTQLALSLVSLFNQAYHLQLSQSQIAQLSGRGARSGIGLGAFEQGGFLVDVGKQNELLPVIAFRHEFPKNWRVILVCDKTHIGVHGAHELNAFNTLKPMHSNLKNRVLERMVPALQRGDLLAFGAYMDDLQAYNGAYFGPAQGGLYASQHVENALNYLRQHGVACVGQSSWGPTGFAIIESEAKANIYLENLKKQFADEMNLSFTITQGFNQGAMIKAE